MFFQCELIFKVKLFEAGTLHRACPAVPNSMGHATAQHSRKPSSRLECTRIHAVRIACKNLTPPECFVRARSNTRTCAHKRVACGLFEKWGKPIIQWPTLGFPHHYRNYRRTLCQINNIINVHIAHALYTSSARPLRGRKFRKKWITIGRRWPTGNILRCRNNKTLKL